MRHIVLVIGHYKNGGVAMRATNLANEFGKRGYPVTILVTKEIGTEVFFELHDNVELVSLKKYIKSVAKDTVISDDTRRQNKLIKNLKRMRYVTRIFPKLDYKLENEIRNLRKGMSLRSYIILHQDAVYIPFGITYYEETFCAAKNLACKIIYAERNAPELEFPDEEKAKDLFAMLAKADGAVLQTEDEYEFHKNHLRKNVAVINNPIKQNLPLPYCGERRKVIVNYCRVALQKNLTLLIDAFVKLYMEYPDYELVIYGNAVEKNEELLCCELKKYVESLRLQDVIHILPPAADVHEKVLDCAMFVSSSDFEGLSNSMIEAMAIGLPCVCTDCLGGGAREVIEHEENGLLVPIKDVDALYKGMKRLIEDPELARKCGENAEKIRARLSIEKVADKWLEVIESV